MDSLLFDYFLSVLDICELHLLHFDFLLHFLSFRQFNRTMIVEPDQLIDHIFVLLLFLQLYCSDQLDCLLVETI